MQKANGNEHLIESILMKNESHFAATRIDLVRCSFTLASRISLILACGACSNPGLGCESTVWVEALGLRVEGCGLGA